MKGQKYNPGYDPLIDKTPGTNVNYAPSYWVDSAGNSPTNDGILEGTTQADVAIIGGGFTGLATAMFLAKEHNIKSTVLEANQVGWGCTSRNGGQGHLAWGRLSRRAWAKRWGLPMAKKIHENTLEAFTVFRDIVYSDTIDCEPFGEGNILIAHSKPAMQQLRKESDFCNNFLKYKTTIINRETLHNNYIKDLEGEGAMIEPIGIAVHPLKLAFGYLKAAKKYGAKVFVGSPLIDWQYKKNKYFLSTPRGMLTANKLIIATAGYTHPSLHPLLAYRNMPIMANNAVTETLNSEQIERAGLKTHLFCTDSRRLRFYYRFLPDKRLQIGTRSAITGADAQNPKHLQIIKEAISYKFPTLKNVKIEYFCSGWMDISHDMIPRIVKADNDQEIYYAQGYSGNGVSFSAYASRELAKLVAGGNTRQDLPIFSSPLKTHPLRILRRPGQRLLFKYYSLLDKVK